MYCMFFFWICSFIRHLLLCSSQKSSQSNQLKIIIHRLCWLSIKQVYLACSKCIALIMLVLHPNILCNLVAFLSSQWYCITPLSCSVTCTFLGWPFSQRRCLECNINCLLKGICAVLSSYCSYMWRYSAIVHYLIKR